MEGAAIFLILLLVLVTAGFMAYMYVDYRAYKVSADKKLTDIDAKGATNATAIGKEGETRLANVKHVVKQINTVNTDIYDKIDSKFAEVSKDVVSVNTAATNLSKMDAKFMTGLDTFFKFESSTGSPTSIYDYTTASSPASLKLMQDVNLAGNLTANDLSNATTGTKKIKLCGTGTPASCIEMPNAAGDTYLTSLIPGKKIVMGAPVNFEGGLSSTSGNMFINGNLGVYGETTPSATQAAPTAVLEVFPKAGKPTFKAGTFTIDANNGVVIGTAAGAATATLTITPANELLITPPSGGIRVAGDIKVSGAIKATGLVTPSTTL